MGKMRCDEFLSSLMDFVSSFSSSQRRKINFTLKLKNVAVMMKQWIWEPKLWQ